MDTLIATGANVSLMKKILQIKQDLNVTNHKTANEIAKIKKRQIRHVNP